MGIVHVIELCGRTVLRGWLGERDDLCVVGDPAQTIYSFAGAEPGLPKRFTIDTSA